MDVPHATRERRRWVVVSYDIPDDKRRTKIMKIIEGYGRRAQYSVFECEVRPADLQQLQERLRDVIDNALDDVRFYSLCNNCLGRVVVMGKGAVHRQKDYEVV